MTEHVEKIYCLVDEDGNTKPDFFFTKEEPELRIKWMKGMRNWTVSTYTYCGESV